MPVSTTAGLINVGRGAPINAFPTSPETSKIMLHAAGMRTPKEVVAEFFGLRQAKEYDDQGNIIDIIDETKDVEALIRVGAHYSQRFAELGLTREMFDTIIPPRLLTIVENANKPVASNQGAVSVGGGTTEQGNSDESASTEEQSTVSKPRGRAKKSQGSTGE